MLTLEQTLVNNGLLTVESIEQAQNSAAEEGKTIEEVLLAGNMLDELSFRQVQAAFYGMDFLEEVPEELIDTELICQFSISYLKKHLAVPLKEEDGELIVGMTSPSAHTVMNDFSIFFDEPVTQAVLLTENTVTMLIDRAFGDSQEDADVTDVLEGVEDFNFDDLDDDKINDLLDDSSDAPFIKLVNMVLTQAVRAGASDVHIEPFKDNLRVRFRLDGVLYNKHTFTKKFHAAIVSRIKVMAKLNIAEKRLPQDGRIALTLGGRQVDLRVSTLPTSYGERVVMRLLEKSSRILSMKELGLQDDDLEMLAKMTRIPHGIILVTGPTGSGKTTSLYAALSDINSPDKNIMTIEDPVEYQLEGIGQIQVNSKTGLTFAEGLRSIVRQDPDVILIGEIRDKETAEIAIQSALTGHLVFSTLHTNDAPSAVTRLIDMGVEPFLLASVLRIVVAQRLVRVLCPNCRREVIATPDSVAECGTMADHMVGKPIYQADGCPECMDTGYRGRQAVYEIMQVTDPVKRQIMANADSGEIRRQAVVEGMRTLRSDGCAKVLQGLTSVTEIMRVSNL
ncbi:type II secretion system ATPase GspE [Halodesulfovibrio spirochaetisodalis]|uniref:protein-secreting ATPase n=1 Tax=Halodesulfovibrio spirochaetisodalis TaxID=1560234 RepID=A0A1B7XB46_9BACT|nr:type II secretion system ATPase GspE [Halodesulfovibrio spirochaetisodalis]OBQ46598.1 general secretion pathway protein GspE [Halodesulfovibrio spirochaetisodalis]